MTPGVDQRHIRPVEGRQVVVVKTGPLAEAIVPRLQRLCGFGVGHDVCHPAADLFHLEEVGERGQLVEAGEFDAELLGAGLQLEDLARDRRPAIAHQVLIEDGAADQRGKVLHPLLLPA